MENAAKPHVKYRRTHSSTKCVIKSAQYLWYIIHKTYLVLTK